MTKDTNKILAKIRALEEEKAKLIPLRKEEVWGVLVDSGGLTLDNRLLAGLAVYANENGNKEDSFLENLRIIGSKVLPSKKSKATKQRSKALKSGSAQDTVSTLAEKKEDNNG